jgi:NADH:ubiquinone reductase (H+-translocating)
VGRLIARRLRGKPALPPFKYFDKGNMATISRGFAVMESFGMRSSGLFATLVWAVIHLQFLVSPSHRFRTAFRWLKMILTHQVLARIIIEPEPLRSPW